MSKEKVTITYDVELSYAQSVGRTFTTPFGDACRAAVAKYDAEQKAKRWDAYDEWRILCNPDPKAIAKYMKGGWSVRCRIEPMANCFGALDMLVRIYKAVEDSDCACVREECSKCCGWTDGEVLEIEQAIAAMIPDDIARSLFGAP